MMNQPHENQGVSVCYEPDWGFDEDGPRYNLKFKDGDIQFWQRVDVDPAPCYTHDMSLVIEEFEHCRRVMPLPIPMRVFILAHEGAGRTNGTYYDTASGTYVENDKWVRKEGGIIVLSGKRIPIHPAMTRYLVAHEYGHAVQYCWERFKGLKADEMESKYYKALRPDTTLDYGPTKWHTNVGELIANDFRCLIAMRELEFWPHPGYARPESLPDVVKFWNQVYMDMLSGTPAPKED